MNKLILPIAFAIIGMILFATNPKEDQFKVHLRSMFEAESESDDIVGRIVTNLIAKPAAWAINEATERDDYVLFSVYTIQDDEGDNTIFLGMLNNFYEL